MTFPRSRLAGISVLVCAAVALAPALVERSEALLLPAPATLRLDDAAAAGGPIRCEQEVRVQARLRARPCAGDLLGLRAHPLAPGEGVVSRVTFSDVSGPEAVEVAVRSGAPCSQTGVGVAEGGATDLCSRIGVRIDVGRRRVFDGTLAALGADGSVPVLRLARGASITYTISTELDPAVDDRYQGLSATASVGWDFTQVSRG